MQRCIDRSRAITYPLLLPNHTGQTGYNHCRVSLLIMRRWSGTVTDNAPCCIVLEFCTAPFLPGVDVGCVGQESSHKCIVAVSCPSERRCKGRLERPCMIAWCTQRRSDSKRFRGDAMPFFFFEFNFPPLYLPFTLQV